MIARTFPPAKLNLFLELLGRREDGYHEIDTVMVPIDWCDELRVQPIDEDEIRLTVDWAPSLEAVAKELGIGVDSDAAKTLLRLPTDDSNLVSRALKRFRQIHGISNGFAVELTKQIPAGAGMGGASSDAASALRCAATLSGLPLDDPSLVTIAAEIGSDVPFFMGLGGNAPVAAARGTGRGERLESIEMPHPLSLVAVFPAISLSTAEVYSIAQLPTEPASPTQLIDRLASAAVDPFADELVNRLAEPAKKLAPRISEVLESLCRLGLETCQMTGSGSACFAIANSSGQAELVAAEARNQLQPGALVRSVRTITVPASIDLIPLGKT